MTAPPVSRADGLPARVTVYEVGPRDGLQNEATVVPTQTKAEFVRRLIGAGLPVVEVTSMVRPDRVPQLADAEALLDLVAGWGTGSAGPPDLPVLVPNVRGLDRAIARGVTHVAVFASATESFAQRNLGRSWQEQFEMFDAVLGRAMDQGMRVRAYVSMCFGDPWEGRVDVARVVDTGQRLLGAGAEQLSLGDTIGVATPGQVRQLVDAFGSAGTDVSALALHVHDTYGQALANAYAALQAGVTTLDASAGGLGGCPYAPGATGNLATEDLVWMLHGLGIDTGVDLGLLVETSRWMAAQLGRPSDSKVVRAMAATADLGDDRGQR
jgi:hydroxymethylglutaryl-CoA lyase